MNGIQSVLTWVAAASAAGFLLSLVFAGLLRLRRNIFLIFYIPLTAALFAAFVIVEDIDLAGLVSRNWIWGLAAAAVVSVIAVRNVLAQPSSPRRRGAALLLDILWPGIAYGLIDGLLISVIPVAVVYEELSGASWAAGAAGRMELGAIALAASFLVAGIYHAGYPEFRGKNILWAIFGNGLMSLAYIVTANPLAAVLPHIAMHVASMIHGRETTVQLPPHYDAPRESG